MGIIYAEQVACMEVDHMQETHEEEIDILNAIDKLYNKHYSGKDTLPELEVKVEEYIEHVQKHFEDEENLMIKYGFPNYGMHKVAHDTFLDELRYAISLWKKSGNLDKIMNFVHKTPEWLVMHINTVDVPTDNYLAAKMKAEEEA